MIGKKICTIVLVFLYSYYTFASPTTVDIFVTTFFPIGKPFDCDFEQRRAAQIEIDPTRNLEYDASRPPNRNLQQSIFAPDSPLAIAASHNTSRLIDSLEKNLTSGSTSRESFTTSDDDIDVVDLIHSVSSELFHHSTFSLPLEIENLREFLGTGEIVLCTGSSVFKTHKNPLNIANTACHCSQKSRRKEGRCEVIKRLSTSTLFQKLHIRYISLSKVIIIVESVISNFRVSVWCVEGDMSYNLAGSLYAFVQLLLCKSAFHIATPDPPIDSNIHYSIRNPHLLSSLEVYKCSIIRGPRGNLSFNLTHSTNTLAWMDN